MIGGSQFPYWGPRDGLTLLVAQWLTRERLVYFQSPEISTVAISDFFERLNPPPTKKTAFKKRPSLFHTKGVLWKLV